MEMSYPTTPERWGKGQWSRESLLPDLKPLPASLPQASFLERQSMLALGTRPPEVRCFQGSLGVPHKVASRGFFWPQAGLAGCRQHFHLYFFIPGLLCPAPPPSLQPTSPPAVGRRRRGPPPLCPCPLRHLCHSPISPHPPTHTHAHACTPAPPSPWAPPAQTEQPSPSRGSQTSLPSTPLIPLLRSGSHWLWILLHLSCKLLFLVTVSFPQDTKLIRSSPFQQQQQQSPKQKTLLACWFPLKPSLFHFSF